MATIIKHALYARLETKSGQEKAVAQFPQQGLQLANQEAITPIWFAPHLSAAAA